LTKHAVSIHAYVKNEEQIGKVILRKVATSRKSKTHHRKLKNKTNLRLLVFDCDVQDALLILTAYL